MKSLSAISFTLRDIMNPHSGIDGNNKKYRTKAIAAAIPMAGIVLAVALLSGLSMVNSYPPAIAQQQNITAGTNATTTSPTAGGGGATTERSACAPTQTGGGGGQNATTTTNATTMGGGGGGTNATAGNASTAATNATTTAGGGNQTTSSSPIQLIEQACVAAQNNDTQGVLMNLNLALNALGGSNMTTTEGGVEVEDEDGEEEGEGGVEVEDEDGEEEGAG
jgi:hypothetical protein